MTLDTATLGAPLTDLDDFIGSEPRPRCRPGSDRTVDPAHGTTNNYRSPRRRITQVRGVALLLIALIIGIAFGVWTTGRPAEGPTPETDASPPTGITGFAEMYVATFLSRGFDADDGAAAFMVSIPDVDAPAPYQRYVPRAATIEARRIGDDYWSVVVAAEVLSRIEGGYGPGRLEYYEVAIAASESGYSATSLPLPAAAPVAPVPQGIYGELRAEADDATRAFMVEFLDAYLSGSGRLPRLVTADSRLAAVIPAPAASIDVRDVRSGTIESELWVTALAVLTAADGAPFPTSITVRIADDGGGPYVAEVLAGPPPVSSPAG